MLPSNVVIHTQSDEQVLNVRMFVINGNDGCLKAIDDDDEEKAKETLDLQRYKCICISCFTLAWIPSLLSVVSHHHHYPHLSASSLE